MSAVEKMTKEQLLSLLKSQGHSGLSKKTKPELISMLGTATAAGTAVGGNGTAVGGDAPVAAAAVAVAAPKKGNEKRKESCKMVGGEKKRIGHSVEAIFQKQFGKGGVVVTKKPKADSKPEADSTMDLSNPNTRALDASLLETFGIDVAKAPNVSNKRGRNLQFVLGRIPELESPKTDEERLAAVSKPALWQKYLKKTASPKPADWLVYLDETAKQWIFFKMDDVVNYIVTHSVWRILATGRMKGDFEGIQYLTYEYRSTHNSYFLGANGNKGNKWITLLMKKNLRHLKVSVEEDK
jgi:hypothetical protein